MLIECPGCGKQLQVPESAAGKKAKCPACGHVFDVIESHGVTAAPPAPAVRQSDEEKEDRPRRRSSRDEDEDDDRPRRRSSRDDDDNDRPRRSRRDDDDDYDDRPRRGSGSPRDKASWVAMWLTIGAVGLIAHLLVFSIGSYFVADAQNRIWERGFNVNFGGVQMNMPGVVLRQNPVSAMMISLLIGLVFYAAFVVLMFIGAGNWRNISGRGLALTGVIMATVAGGLLVLQPIFDLMGYVTWFQIVRVLFSLGVAVLLLIGGIRGIMIAGHPDVKEAFGEREGGRRRRRSRDDDY